LNNDEDCSNIVATEVATMHTQLRKIGNSKGIILPGALIAACGLETEVDLRIQGRTIIIEAAGKPRSHWFDSFVAEAEEPDPWDAIPTDEGTEEWAW
jgi:antitoxin MazE